MLCGSGKGVNDVRRSQWQNSMYMYHHPSRCTLNCFHLVTIAVLLGSYDKSAVKEDSFYLRSASPR